ncbi:MAG: hypothetical protein GX256_06360 [Fretibacterium sp.]|nr:hypothetical protein [Fretibacterium sp.]
MVNFLRRGLPARSQVRGVALAEGDEALVTLVLSAEKGAHEEGAADWAEQLASFLLPMGLRLQAVWVEGDVPDPCATGAGSPLFRSPWFWMGGAAAVALLVNAGTKVFFWTLFWGTAGWFAARFAPLLFRCKNSGVLDDAALRR